MRDYTISDIVEISNEMIYDEDILFEFDKYLHNLTCNCSAMTILAALYRMGKELLEK